MAKLITGILVLLSTSFLSSLQLVESQLIEIEPGYGNLFSVVTGLYQITSNLKRYAAREKNLNNILNSIDNIHNQTDIGISTIAGFLRELPKELQLIEKRRELQDHFDRIHHTYKKALVLDWNARNDGGIEDKDDYRRFADTYEIDIWESIFYIHKIVLDKNVATYLMGTFIDELLTFENICTTGMSQLQLLDNLLTTITIATAEYYNTETLMRDFLESTGSPVDETARQELLDEIIHYRKSALTYFKNIMKSASTDFYLCDPSNGYTGDTYSEISAFSKYIFDENAFRDVCTHNAGTCETIEVLEYDRCINQVSKVCEMTRLCPNSLMNCRQIEYDHAKVCIEKLPEVSEVPYLPIMIGREDNPKPKNRYLSVILQKKDEDKYQCKNNSETEVLEVMYQFMSQSTCRFCECVCEENQYFISTQSVLAEISSNKVVTGVKLTMQDKTLYIQIEEGQLLANGIINRTTVELRPIVKNDEARIPFGWRDIREMDLTEVKLSKDQVLTGFKFHVSSTKRVSLSVLSNKFNLTTGKLEGLPEQHIPLSGQTKYDISNDNSPIKATDRNKIDTKKNQFVEFTMTNLLEDGGQTVIPFIDTRLLKTNPKTILSGASLTIRGQKGYGGFLIVKLFTYDMRPYIVDDYMMEDQERFLTELKTN